MVSITHNFGQPGRGGGRQGGGFTLSTHPGCRAFEGQCDDVGWGYLIDGTRRLNRHSTRQICLHKATFAFGGSIFADVITNADKRKCLFVQINYPNGKHKTHSIDIIFPPGKNST